MKSLAIRLLQKNKKLFIGLVVLDFTVLFLHLTFGKNYSFFHLDFEQNLPTLYQSFKLIVFGLIFFILGLNRKIKREVKSFILPLSLFLTFLGLDELFQVHENIYRIFELFDWFHPSKIVDLSMKMGYRSSLWILYYLPMIVIFVFWSGYWLRHFQSKMKNNASILILSSSCLFIVLLTEILSSTGTYSENAYFWLVTLEEIAEMLLATTLVLVGNKMVVKMVGRSINPHSPRTQKRL